MNRNEHMILGKDQDIIENAFPNETENCLRYLQDLAAENELKSEDGEPLLKKRYENLGFNETDSAMSVYMNPKKYAAKTYGAPEPIFPFGGNASQFKAVTK